jgi:hypothetical protein
MRHVQGYIGKRQGVVRRGIGDMGGRHRNKERRENATLAINKFKPVKSFLNAFISETTGDDWLTYERY